jgi:hypothetical protein
MDRQHVQSFRKFVPVLDDYSNAATNIMNVTTDPRSPCCMIAPLKIDVDFVVGSNTVLTGFIVVVVAGDP